MHPDPDPQAALADLHAAPPADHADAQPADHADAQPADQPVGPPLPGWTTRPRPLPGPFSGRYGGVVRLQAGHAAALYAECDGPGNRPLWTYLNEGPFGDPEAFTAYVVARAADPAQPTASLLDGDGRPAGIASYLRLAPEHGSVEVGGILLGRSLQRTRAATEAMHLMAAHVFEDLGYRRYEWKCDALNAPSRAAATRLGFIYEGTFRNAAVTKGRSRDTAWYSITDAEWPAVAAAHRAWLDPANHDAAGRQRRRLAELLGALRDPEPRGR